MTIACTLNTADRVRRRERWLGLRAEEVVETPTGLRLVFRASPSVFREVHELAELERECCAFATWTVRDDGDDVILDVDAEAEGITAVHAMFEDFRATLAGA